MISSVAGKINAQRILGKYRVLLNISFWGILVRQLASLVLSGVLRPHIPLSLLNYNCYCASVKVNLRPPRDFVLTHYLLAKRLVKIKLRTLSRLGISGEVQNL